MQCNQFNFYTEPSKFRMNYCSLQLYLALSSLFQLIWCTQIIHSRLLEKKTLSELQMEEFNRTFSEWYSVDPTKKFFFNTDYMQLDNTADFKKIFEASGLKNLTNNFRWVSISMFNHKMGQEPFVILGGAQLDIKNVHRKTIISNKARVILCKLKNKLDFGLVYDECHQLPNGKFSHLKDKFLSTNVDSLSISKDSAVILYCDPYWHLSNSTSEGPCLYNIIQKGRIRPTQKLSVGALTCLNEVNSNCLIGFSAKLAEHDALSMLRHSRLQDRFKILLGSPLANKINVIYSPLTETESKLKTFILANSSFIGSYGFQTAENYAPIYGYYNFNTRDRILSLISEASHENFDWIGTSPSDFDDFQGFGFSIISIKLRSRTILIVGAPFVGENAGRIYLYSPPRKDPTDILDFHTSNAFFGYSLADLSTDKSSVIAVGVPYLNSKKSLGGEIILIEIFPNYTFNRRPLQRLQSNQADFGNLLPKHTSDIDFNGQPDLIIPSVPNTSIYLAKRVLTVYCKFIQSSSPHVVHLRESNTINFKIKVGIYDELLPEEMMIPNLSKLHLEFVHQINPDFNFAVKRLRVLALESHFKSNMFTVDVNLTIVDDMLEMSDIVINPPVIAYRFLTKCRESECPVNFSWSSCQNALEIKRYTCSYNISNCLSDLALVSSHKEIHLIYKGNYLKEIPLTIKNNGPTEAAGVKLIVSSYGNVRITMIMSSQSDKLKTSIDNTRRFGYVDFGRFFMNEINLTVITLYELESDYELLSGFELELHSYTFDPNLNDNRLNIPFLIFNIPDLRISVGPLGVSDLYDNSTEPQRMPGVDQRVNPAMLGPKISHIYQIEHQGPSQRVENLTLNVYLPISILPYTNRTRFEIDHLFYMFEHIRINNGILDLKPSIYSSTSKRLLAVCELKKNERIVVNQRGMIAIALKSQTNYESSTIHRRRRSINAPFISSTGKDNLTMNDNSMFNIQIKNNEKIFRKNLREFFMCGRESIRFSKPFCATFECNLPILEKNSPVELRIEAWLWIKTFFKYRISDLVIASEVDIGQGATPAGVYRLQEPLIRFSISQSVVFDHIRPKLLHIMLIWPMIVGISIGLLILSNIAALLHSCGFFEHKDEELLDAHIDKVGLPKLNPNQQSKTILEYWEQRSLEHSQVLDVCKRENNNEDSQSLLS